eukprot:m.78768 g.78768  ORF g.78768 m.78768 type:complete len:545 (-) comp9245_c0_seq1:350-1984(-)
MSTAVYSTYLPRTGHGCVLDVRNASLSNREGSWLRQPGLDDSLPPSPTDCHVASFIKGLDGSTQAATQAPPGPGVQAAKQCPEGRGKGKRRASVDDDDHPLSQARVTVVSAAAPLSKRARPSSSPDASSPHELRQPCDHAPADAESPSPFDNIHPTMCGEGPIKQLQRIRSSDSLADESLEHADRHIDKRARHDVDYNGTASCEGSVCTPSVDDATAVNGDPRGPSPCSLSKDGYIRKRKHESDDKDEQDVVVTGSMPGSTDVDDSPHIDVSLPFDMDSLDHVSLDLGDLGMPLLDDPVGMAAAHVVPETWEPCAICAKCPWPDGKHHGTAVPDPDGVVRCHVVPVDASTAEHAWTVLPLVQHGVEIVEVLRVQNHRLYSKFLAKATSEAFSPWDTSSKDLWHGTTTTDVHRLVREGLDQRVATRGHFGRGLYFSDNAGKAHRYTSNRDGKTPNDDGIRTMLRCKVQLGKMKSYPHGVNDTSLLREPDGYDSVMGNISGQNEFVIYENDRVYIDYVIKYRLQPEPVPHDVAGIAQELRNIVSQL